MGCDEMVGDLKTSTIPPSNLWEGSVYGMSTGVKGKSHLLGRTDQDSLRLYYATQNNVKLPLAGWLFNFNFKINLKI